MLRRICLIGVRGVGKTSLIRSLINDLPRMDYVVGSQVLRDLVGPDFAHFDHFPKTKKQRYREAAIDWMVERQRREGRHILCDGHTSLLDESTGEVEAVFTERDCMFFRELILIEAPADVVLERRRHDTMKRRSLDPDIVAAELHCERETSRSIAEQWSIQLHCLPENTSSLARDHLWDILS